MKNKCQSCDSKTNNIKYCDACCKRYNLSNEGLAEENSVKHTGIKKDKKWEYYIGTILLSMVYTLLAYNYNSSSSSIAFFVGRFFGFLVIPIIVAFICSSKRYKFEKLLFFVALFIFIMVGIQKVF